MGKIAFVFSGQGAQFTGMGSSLYEGSASARAVFDQADKIRPGTSAQCFTADKEELSQTKNTQSCVYTVNMAAAAALSEKGIFPQAAAGFSLGEMCALAFGGAFSINDGLRHTIKRAEIMEEESRLNPGVMAAVLKLPAEKVAELCGQCGVYAVNFNCPGQIVAAGGGNEMELFAEKVAAEGGRALKLAVSGAFHSPHMGNASKRFYAYLQQTTTDPLFLPVYSNVTAAPYGEGVKELLSRQISSPVLWQKTIENMAAQGFDTFIEAGTGSVLAGLIAKTVPQAKAFKAGTAEDILTIKNHLQGAK